MPASFTCPNPNCWRSVLVADDQRGIAIRCPQCQTAFRTPPLMAAPVTAPTQDLPALASTADASQAASQIPTLDESTPPRTLSLPPDSPAPTLSTEQAIPSVATAMTPSLPPVLPAPAATLEEPQKPTAETPRITRTLPVPPLLPSATLDEQPPTVSLPPPVLPQALLAEDDDLDGSAPMAKVAFAPAVVRQAIPVAVDGIQAKDACPQPTAPAGIVPPQSTLDVRLSGSARVRPPRRRRLGRWIASGSAIVGLLVAALFVLQPTPQPEPVAKDRDSTPIVKPANTNVTTKAPDTRPATKPADTKTTKLPDTKPDEKPPILGKSLENSIGMRFVKIPPGKFLMGSPGGELRRRNDELQHEVELTQAYWMGVYEVTQAEYEKVMGTNPSEFSKKGALRNFVQGLDTRRFPVDKVSWDDAKEFCSRLSQEANEQKAGRKYRLPTEAEWEYACRGGAASPSPFHYGDTLTSELANFNGTDPYPDEAKKGLFLNRPTTVGSYKPNDFGLYDMHGNVQEWCEDRYGTYNRMAVKDPAGPMGEPANRVLRGGSFTNAGWFCRSALRGNNAPHLRINTYGFRVICVPVGVDVPPR